MPRSRFFSSLVVERVSWPGSCSLLSWNQNCVYGTLIACATQWGYMNHIMNKSRIHSNPVNVWRRFKLVQAKLESDSTDTHSMHESTFRHARYSDQHDWESGFTHFAFVCWHKPIAVRVWHGIGDTNSYHILVTFFRWSKQKYNEVLPRCTGLQAATRDWNVMKTESNNIRVSFWSLIWGEKLSHLQFLSPHTITNQQHTSKLHHHKHVLCQQQQTWLFWLLLYF